MQSKVVPPFVRGGSRFLGRLCNSLWLFSTLFFLSLFFLVSCVRSSSGSILRSFEVILVHNPASPIQWSNYHFSLHDLGTGLYAPIGHPAYDEDSVMLSFGKPSLAERPLRSGGETKRQWNEGSFSAQLTIYDISFKECGKIRFRVKATEKGNKVVVTELFGHEGFKEFQRMAHCRDGICSVFFIDFKGTE
ncbi:hypothetical protein [Porphyromonas circumdentaria]|uniref:Uncharacterized protein n=1 Tax=Porphyromonas circumdentaria TaxID=29524 RepID=A0A1T4LV76_9PORP|nr:hypothetical protein [Porphyromonas circumdentaria]MBB6275416.1 hypothetical protein [Porphyromonas circumdentaria]MDO4722113.1 hypothetical protein [Porphyromonas circumdentaria]SJZ58633.1 hypothetical protein SAMN02745171_00543 [Porphyromonas circumdentaria]